MATVRIIDWPSLKKLLNSSFLNTPVRLIDVREPHEHAAGCIPRSVNIPLATIPDHLKDLSTTSTALVFYCQSGKRSYLAAQEALKLGFQDVASYAGSYGEYSKLSPQERCLS
jgi:rhodanese-related sulfurtransferase